MNDRRDFLMAGMLALAAPVLSERLTAEGSEPRVEGQRNARESVARGRDEGRTEGQP